MRDRCLALLLLGMLALGFASAAEASPRRAVEPGIFRRAPLPQTAPRKAPEELLPISIRLLLGYGLTLSETDRDGADVNLYGFGFGAAGGYEYAHVYFGARCTLFLGDSARVAGLLVSRNEMTLGFELGYSFRIARVSLRPELGFGLAIGRSERETTDAAGLPVTEDASSEDFYAAAGFAALYDLNPRVFVGIDAQVPVILAEETIKGLTFLANVGMRF